MAKTFSVVLVGVECHVIEIEAVVASGFSGIHLLGIGGDVVRDMRERVRSALESADFVLPAKRIVVNLTPATSLRLARTPLEELDFAVAAAVVLAIDEDRNPSADDGRPQSQRYFLGELSLTGLLRPLSRPSPVESLLARLRPDEMLFLPRDSGLESARNSRMVSVNSFLEWCSGREGGRFSQVQAEECGDLAQPTTGAFGTPLERVERVLGFYSRPSLALVTLLVAAAGRHNLLLAGEPGVGKSFLAQRLMELQPPLSEPERAEVTLIQASDICAEARRLDERPFRSPHHTATSAALIGGASLRPGEVTLAHRGLLFLDELAEFGRGALEALREPLDSGRVVLSRASGAVEFPASFQLCAATNPCPCGFLLSRRRSCRCSPTVVRKYHLKLSGPILDRFALQVWLGDEPEAGLFQAALESTLRNEGAAALARRFLVVQRDLYFLSDKAREDALAAFHLPPMDITVSRRGEKHLRQLALTFVRLFPEAGVTPEFWREIAQFRLLENKLGQALRYS